MGKREHPFSCPIRRSQVFRRLVNAIPCPVVVVRWLAIILSGPTSCRRKMPILRHRWPKNGHSYDGNYVPNYDVNSVFPA
jgi:hypothetical protein